MTTKIDQWLPSGQAALALGVSVKSLKRYADIHEFLVEGMHWQHGPLCNSPRVWNVDACREALAYRGRIRQEVKA